MGIKKRDAFIHPHQSIDTQLCTLPNHFQTVWGQILLLIHNKNPTLSIILLCSIIQFNSIMGMEKCTFLCTLFVVLCVGWCKGGEDDLLRLYEQWMGEHGKAYNDLLEKEARFHIFKNNLAYIDEHNQKNESYKLGLNKFADLTHNEFKNMYLGTLFRSTRSPSLRYQYAHGDRLPTMVDWRNNGAVTGVKDQGSCGTIICLLF